jgi:hypothetical protein
MSSRADKTTMLEVTRSMKMLQFGQTTIFVKNTPRSTYSTWIQSMIIWNTNANEHNIKSKDPEMMGSST